MTSTIINTPSCVSSLTEHPAMYPDDIFDMSTTRRRVLLPRRVSNSSACMGKDIYDTPVVKPLTHALLATCTPPSTPKRRSTIKFSAYNGCPKTPKHLQVQRRTNAWVPCAELLNHAPALPSLPSSPRSTTNSLPAIMIPLPTRKIDRRKLGATKRTLFA